MHTLTANNAQGAQLKTPPFKRIFATQGVVLLLVSLTLLGLFDFVVAYSALIGGLVSIAPSLYFSRWAFRFSGAHAANNVARSFYIGETGKFILTVLLFAAVFAWVKPLNIPIFFLIYILMMALNWILALRLIKSR